MTKNEEKPCPNYIQPITYSAQWTSKYLLKIEIFSSFYKQPKNRNSVNQLTDSITYSWRHIVWRKKVRIDQRNAYVKIQHNFGGTTSKIKLTVDREFWTSFRGNFKSMVYTKLNSSGGSSQSLLNMTFFSLVTLFEFSWKTSLIFL